MTCWRSGKWMKWQLGETAIWQNGKLMKWPSFVPTLRIPLHAIHWQKYTWQRWDWSSVPSNIDRHFIWVWNQYLWGPTTLGLTIFSIKSLFVTLGLTTFSVKSLFVTLGCYAECRNGEASLCKHNARWLSVTRFKASAVYSVLKTNNVFKTRQLKPRKGTGIC